MAGNQQVKQEFDGAIISLPTTVTTPLAEATQLDDAGGSITYVGKAAIGSATSSAVWRIQKIDESGDPELIITWADGNSNYDNVWDNRASLSYS